jgi:hypothetical protein
MSVGEVKKYSRVACIKNYFGDRENQNASMWIAELKALNDAEKNYLATGAAKGLGLSQEQCDFVFV